MYRYGQYCPVARAVEILGDRWTLLIVRDLLLGTCHFNDLKRGLPGISTGLLASRLQRLQDVGIVEKQMTDAGRRTTRYAVTMMGKELKGVIGALLTWGTRWSFAEPEPDELNPFLLLWWMRDRILVDRLPMERVVVEFDFTETEDCYWLVIRKNDVSVCIQHPGYEVDVVVTADLAAFLQVWLGRMTYLEAVRERQVRVEALPSLLRDFPRWFAWSAAAPAVREAAALNDQRENGIVLDDQAGAPGEPGHRADPIGVRDPAPTSNGPAKNGP